CIGSAFNVKGVMQCPNCRKVEKGQWLFSNGTRSCPELSLEDWAHDEDLYDPSYSEIVLNPGMWYSYFANWAKVIFSSILSPQTTHELKEEMNEMKSSLANVMGVLKVLIDRRNPSAVDIDGVPLPTLVYMARENRPSHPHNFKAGAMNALIRVSSKISNGTIILNVDCDMSSNNSESVRDAVCFFMDEKQGHEFAFVQYPHCFNNLTQNDISGGVLTVIQEERDSAGGSTARNINLNL
ncbi:hypothetical protein IFM89_030129, partial [Coptis chinensis]